MVQSVIEKQKNLEQNASQGWIFQSEGQNFDFRDHEGFHEIMVDEKKKEHQQKHDKETFLYFFKRDFVLFIIIENHQMTDYYVCHMEIKVFCRVITS